MAHFRAEIIGKKTSVSRLGHKDGLTTKCYGWDHGIDVVCFEENGNDVFKIYVTGGANNTAARKEIATVVDGNVNISIS